MTLDEETVSFDVPADFYIPDFLWNFWVEACPPEDRNFTPWTNAQPIGLHIYDALKYELASAENVQRRCRNIFVHIEELAPSALLETPIWQKLNSSFNTLEKEAETAIRSLIQQMTARTRTRATSSSKAPEGARLSLGRHSTQALKKYLIFLRFRNLEVYKVLIKRAELGILFGRHKRAQSSEPATSRSRYKSPSAPPNSPDVSETCEYDDVINWVRLSESFVKFFEGGTYGENDTHQFKFIYEIIHRRFSAIHEVELCVGAATETDEFILSPMCFGVVDDSNPASQPAYSQPYFHYFFPITPRFVIYLFIDASTPDDSNAAQPHFLSREARISETIDYGDEVDIDIFQRNALLLQHVPAYVIFASARSMIRTLTYYSQRRLPGSADYNKLLWLCRKEGVTYTLLIKASIEVIDLTDDVTRVGEAPVAHGSFADVWKGLWTDRQDKGQKKLVALKILRAHIVGNAQERLLKRLRKEISAWHRLQHPNIAQLHGVMQLPYTVAMVSPWCDNGTVVKYLKEKNPDADRLLLLHEIASGINYLHSCSPPVVHGDLKGCNILVDSGGHAIITDFGLAQVLEEVADAITEWPSSVHLGSTRWMAPELMMAMFDDDGLNDENSDQRSQRTLPITTCSDVYAFASVCLEVLTGALPYPNRRDPVVTLDVIRGVRPTRGSVWLVDKAETEHLWELMNKCWEFSPHMRPSMGEMLDCLSKWSSDVV